MEQIATTEIVPSPKLRTKLFHWDLPHPILAAAGPLTGSLASITRLFASGAAAVVTKTITLHPDFRPGGCARIGDLLFNRDGYTRRSLTKWEDDLEALKGKRVIANVFAHTPSELSQVARTVVARGVEILELGMSCPIDGTDPICFDPVKLKDFCRAVRSSVDVPILAKVRLQMSYSANRQMVMCIRESGLDGVCLSDTLPAILLADDGTLVLGGVGGLSGSAMKPLVLKALNDVADLDLVVLGIGGITSGRDVVDYVQVGATAVQVCSVLVRQGTKAMKSIVSDLGVLMENKGKDLWELRGKTRLPME